MEAGVDRDEDVDVDEPPPPTLPMTVGSVAMTVEMIVPGGTPSDVADAQPVTSEVRATATAA